MEHLWNKMKYYRFYDTDKDGMLEYDIFGEEYKKLICVCCMYSSIVSLNFYNEDNLESIEKFKILEKENKSPLSNTLKGKRRYYKVCPELCSILQNEVDSFFAWLSFIDGKGLKPEDLTFFREDGTIFLSSCTHEGVITLRPRKDENITKIIANPLWKEETLEGDKYGVVQRCFTCDILLTDENSAVKIAEKYLNGKYAFKILFDKRYDKHSQTYYVQYHCQGERGYEIVNFILSREKSVVTFESV